MVPFHTNVFKNWGKAGEKWLATLPTLSHTLAQKWHLTHLKPLPNLSYNYVLRGLQNNLPVVLKISFEEKGFQNEVNALKAYRGHGAISLLSYDFENNALLLKEAQPGTSLKTYFPLKEQDAIQITSTLIHSLHQAPFSQTFPLLEDWISSLNADHPFLNDLLPKARLLAKELLLTSPAPVLLHGDLHPENILLKDNEWVAIDPKGVIGDPAFEVSTFIKNPMPEIFNQPNLKEIIEQRIRLFAQYAGLDSLRIKKWSFVQAVLSATWMEAENKEAMQMKKLAELLL